MRASLSDNKCLVSMRGNPYWSLETDVLEATCRTHIVRSNKTLDCGVLEQIANPSHRCQLTLTGQHDRNPVTTKHEKRSHANHLFAVSYGSFLGRPLRSSYEIRMSYEKGCQGKKHLPAPLRDAGVVTYIQPHLIPHLILRGVIDQPKYKF